MGGSSFRTRDVDEAREELDARYYANRMAVVDRERRPFAARFDTVALGPLVIGDLSCGADVRMSFGELGAYHLNAPLSGTMEMRQGGGSRVVATPSEALLLDPAGDTFLDRWSGDCRTLSVKVGAAELRDRLEQLMGRVPRGPLVFAPRLDITRGPGLSWVRFARQVAAEALAGEGSPRTSWSPGPSRRRCSTGCSWPPSTPGARRSSTRGRRGARPRSSG